MNPIHSQALELRFKNHMHFLKVWRIGNWADRKGIPGAPITIRFLTRWIFGADVPVNVPVPRGVIFMHNGLGTVVHTKVRFLGPALVFHNVTLGNSRTLVSDAPSIGKFVVLGAGSCVLGHVAIGNRVVVGANSVVTKDVPDNSLVLGNPSIVRPLPTGLLESFFPEEVLAA